ncbi:MAG: TIGR04255 family protein [Opitutales bacterium]|nr:TIGR04255 family protein [Opitutales bacterium]
MSERQAPALHLPQSPLIFVLGQVRFAPVLSMEEKIPAIQDSLRKNGFPRLSVREIEITKRDANGKTEIERRKQWEFINKEKWASVLIDTDFIVFQVTRYKLFEHYISEFKGILDTFAHHAKPDLVQRIGLRYVDLVIPRDDQKLESYLSPSLRGFSIQGGEHREAFRCESVTQTGDNSRFIHRYMEANNGFGFPPDLLPISLSFDLDLNLNSPFGLLDMDHFMHVDNDFSVQEIIKNFWALHDLQTKAFAASVTKTAMNEWRSE